MARINLLPWRAEERERKNKEFITQVIAILLFTLLAAFAVWSFYNRELDQQKQANELIQASNERLDADLKKIEDLEQRRDAVVSRMRVIQDLQGRRPVPVRVWDDIAQAIPSAMYLTDMKREGNLLTFTGRADNPNIVSSLVRNLNASHWMKDSKLKYIQDDIEAYQPKVNPPVSNTDDQVSRPMYPEDSYIQFVVTTQVSMSTPDTNSMEDSPENQTGEGGE